MRRAPRSTNTPLTHSTVPLPCCSFCPLPLPPPRWLAPLPCPRRSTHAFSNGNAICAGIFRIVFRIKIGSRWDRHRVKRAGSDVCRACTNKRVREAALTGPVNSFGAFLEGASPSTCASPLGRASSRWPSDRSAMSTSVGRSADGLFSTSVSGT